MTKIIAIDTLVFALTIRLASSFCLVPTAAPRAMMHHPSRTLLEATTRPDATSAVQEAMEATKKFGPTSKEARVAWDIVEEMDSSDIR